MIPNTMFSPIVVTMMKKEMSKKRRRADVSNFSGTRGTIYHGIVRNNISVNHQYKNYALHAKDLKLTSPKLSMSPYRMVDTKHSKRSSQKSVPSLLSGNRKDSCRKANETTA